MAASTFKVYRAPYTVTVTVARRLRWRVRVGLLVMRVGAWIATIGYRTREG